MRILSASPHGTNPTRGDLRWGRARSVRGDVGVEAHHDLQVTVHDQEPADGDDFRKFL